jgi:hypothetical protein
VSLPAIPPSRYIGSDYGIFHSTSSTGTITITVPVGAVSAYTSKWGVPTSISANGATSVYGENHKAILITDGVSD